MNPAVNTGRLHSSTTGTVNCNLPDWVKTFDGVDVNGYQVSYLYDKLDRITQITYPDGTTEQFSYSFPTGWPNQGCLQCPVPQQIVPSLDLWKYTDRQGRVTDFNYDRNRRRTSVTETVTVNGATTTRTTSFAYYPNGALKELTDANGNVTRWDIDLQSRPTAKTYAYGTAAAKTESYTYDLAGRLKTVTDAKGQVLTKSYNTDDTLASYAYTNAAVATPGASFTYDPYWPRLTAMTDTFGSTSWTYKALGVNGALQLDTENPPFANDTVAYSYDTLGRVASRTIDVAVDSYSYDVLGRLSQHVIQDFGTFNYGYLGQSGLVTSRTKTVNNISTVWGYDTTANDRRLKTITNSNVARSYTLTSNVYQLTGDAQTMPPTHPWVSQSFAYGYDASDRLLSSTVGSTVTSYGYDKLDNATNFGGVTGTYDGLNQIATFNGVAHTYDANGNLTADGTRTYTYDAADRLIRINYVGSTAKSEFGYDGLGRRITQTETPATGSPTTLRNQWCGTRLCQERTGADVVTARYYPEGECRPVANEAYVYMPDSLGSVRELVGAGSGILKFAYDYDAYGKPTRSWTNVTSPDTKFRYAGLMLHAQSGLYLSTTRAYDPTKGKWLNRDTIGEEGGLNLTGYTGSSPTMQIDPLGMKPGDRFATVEEAACDALSFINPKSIAENKEYSGRIDYEPATDRYIASYPMSGSESNVRTELSTWSQAQYHTHGNYSMHDPNDQNPVFKKRRIIPTNKAHDEFNSDNFSTFDKNESISEQLKYNPDFIT